MGIGSPGFFGEAAHLLAYPRRGLAGFLPIPVPVDLRHAKCESEQVILDRVSGGGIGSSLLR
jgi:hypothetical protein